MGKVSGEDSSRKLTFYGEATSEDIAKEFIRAKRMDGWQILTAPFLVDSRRVTWYRSESDPVPISSTLIDVWAFVLHRFYQDDQ